MEQQISNEQLIQALAQRGLASVEALEGLLQQQQDAFIQSQGSLAGTGLLIDLTRYELVVKEIPQDREFRRIPLHPSAGFHGFKPNDWERWGSHLVVLSPEDGSRLGEFDWQTGALYGLVFNQEKTYLYNEGRLDADYLALSNQALFGGIYKGVAQAAPFDFWLSPSHRWLCVADRGAGNVIVIDTWSFEAKGIVNVREPGRTQSLNLAIDEANERVYITDNLTANLLQLNLRTLEVKRERLTQGQLGNLALAPDGKHLYIVTVKPNEGLVYLNTETWIAEKPIKIKGHLFKADSSDPCDLLSLSPDGKLLTIMTYLNDPQPFTPVISVIDAHHGKTLRRYALKDGIKPFQLAYALPNPVSAHTKRLEELILASGLIEASVLWSVKQELQRKEVESAGGLRAAAEKEKEFKDLRQVPQIHIAIPFREDPDKTLNVQPLKAKQIQMPAEAVEEILDILVTTFQKQVDEDISGYPDVMDKLRNEAEKARAELEEYDSTIIQIDALFEGRSLQTAVLREAILMMLDLKQTVKQTPHKTVPTHCPNCKQALLGSWDCDACGFELDSPERAAKRRIASADAIANLPMGHIVLPDPQGLRLLQLNPYKYVVWNLDPDQLSADYPVDALWLPNNNVLTVDRDGHKVMEVGTRGKVYWSFDTRRSPQHQLCEPAKATYYLPDEAESLSEMRLLIADQAHHRVLEVNRKHEILKEFGVMGVSGNDGKTLNSPSDVQFTHDETYLITDMGNHRLLEFKKDGALKRVFGAGLNLKRPTAAQRLFNDHTLILDSGNYRLIELDPEGQILHETLYYTKAIDEKFRVVSPLKMIRLINKDIVILDEDKLIQIRLKDNQMVWHTMIADLAFQPKVSEPEIIIDENGLEQRVYKLVDHGHMRPVRLSQKINFKRMQKLIEARMRNEALPGESEDDKSASAADRLRALIEDRKLEQKRSLQQELSLDTYQPSEIFQKPDVELDSLRLYCLDRNHNGVIRINRKGEVKWHYGFEMGQKLSKPYHLSETKRTLLVSDTGHNRVIELSKADKDVIMELTGSKKSPLSGPRSAMRLGLGRTLIADQRNKRLVELDSRGEITWEFNKSGQISSPQYVEETDNGHLLFTDSMLNSIREIDREGNLIWSYGSRIKGNGPGQLFAPEFATRLPGGHTLIADTRNNRVIEVDPDGREVWIFTGDPRNRRKLLNPVKAERLENGDTLVTYNNHREMIQITREFETVWYFRMGNDVFLPPVQGDSRKAKHLVEKLTTYYNPIEKRMVKSATAGGMKGYEAHITLLDNVQMKSVRASLIMMRLERYGTVIKTFPSPEELLADKFGKQLIVTFIMLPEQGEEILAEDLSFVAEIESAKLEPLDFEEQPA